MVSSRKDLEEEARKSRLRYIINVYEKQLVVIRESKIPGSGSAEKILKNRIKEIKSELGEE